MDTLELISKSLDRVEDTTREIKRDVSDIGNKVTELQVLHKTEYQYLVQELTAIKTDYSGNSDKGIKGFKSEFKSDFDKFKLKATIFGVIIALTLLALVPGACANDLTYITKIYKTIYTLL